MFNTTLTYFIGLALLVLAVSTWERFDDRKGDLNKREDVFYRGALMFLVANINTLLNASLCEDYRRILFFLGISLNLALASFFLIFDYWITYTLLKNGTIEAPKGERLHWFTYRLGGGLKFWKNASPRTRLIIRASYFLASLIVYIIWT